MADWEQEILDLPVELERKLEGVKDRLKSKGLMEEYNDALTKTKAAREAVHHLIDFYNKRKT